MQTFTVVEQYAFQASDWYVVDDRGEERHRTVSKWGALHFAALLTVQEEDAQREMARRRQDALQAEAGQMVAEQYHRGKADAYRHAHTRLSFLMGGTLPQGSPAFRRELALLLTNLEQHAALSADRADGIRERSEARIQAALDRYPA